MVILIPHNIIPDKNGCGGMVDTVGFDVGDKLYVTESTFCSKIKHPSKIVDAENARSTDMICYYKMVYIKMLYL